MLDFLPVLPDSYGFQLDDPLLQKETKGVKPQPLLLLDLHEHHRSCMDADLAIAGTMIGCWPWPDVVAL